MRHVTLLVGLCLLAPAFRAAEPSTFETLVGQITSATTKTVAATKAKIRKPRIFPLSPRAPTAKELAAPVILDVALADLRDQALSFATGTVAGREWTLGLSTDEDYKTFYLILRSNGSRLLVPLKDLMAFVSKTGVLVEDKGVPVLRLKAELHYLDPFRSSTLVAESPDRKGSFSKFKSGSLVDAVIAKSKTFTLGDGKIRTFLVSTVARDGSALTSEATIVFGFEESFWSKAWVIREADLKPGVPVRGVVFGRSVIVLKTEEGRLIVRNAGIAPEAVRTPLDNRGKR